MEKSDAGGGKLHVLKNENSLTDKRENRYAHPEDDFFLRCGEEAKFLSEDDLNGCERLVRDILRFVRQKFSYEEYRMFMLRFYLFCCN